MEESIKVTPLTQYIIDEVRIRRLEQGISQKKLSELISPSEDTSLVGKVESANSPHKYSGPQLELIADKLGCSVQDFFPTDFLPDDSLQPKTKVAIIKRMGPIAMLNSMLENGYFKDERSLNEITADCNKKSGVIRKTTDFSSTIAGLLDQKKLIKIQVPGKDGVKYSQP